MRILSFVGLRRLAILVAVSTATASAQVGLRWRSAALLAFGG